MSRYVYTIHAKQKLQKREVRGLKISKKSIENVIDKPDAIDTSEESVLIAIGSLTKTLSLSVVYRKVEKGIRMITFYPAEKGRYELKVS